MIADDGRNIALGSSTSGANSEADARAFGFIEAGSSADQDAHVFLGTYTLVSESGSDIVISSDTINIDRAGFEEGTFSGVNSGVVSDGGATTAPTDLKTGDLVINGVAVGFTSDNMDTFSKPLRVKVLLQKRTQSTWSVMSQESPPTSWQIGSTRAIFLALHFKAI